MLEVMVPTFPAPVFWVKISPFDGYSGGMQKICPSRIAATGLLRGQLRFDTSGEGCPRIGSQGLLRAKAFSCWFYKGLFSFLFH